jgi:endo-1,4-beta-xylanase
MNSLDVATHPKTRGMIEKVKKWRAQGIPIDGIGSQSHIQPGSGSKTLAALQALCAAVPECALTEVDIRGSQPNDYVAVAKACLGVKNCVGATLWGVRDSDSWHRQDAPLLFDGAFKPKPAYTAVLQAIS